jgi:hypothetical protein
MKTPRWLLAVVLFAALAHPTVLRAQSDPVPVPAVAPSLEHARVLYTESRFAEAVGVLDQVLREGRVTGDEVNVARELRARCLSKLGRRLESKEAYKGILRSDASYRPNTLHVPPDEMEAFDMALREFQQEQVEAGRRFPASIGFLYGLGNSVNQDMVDLASEAGVEEADDFDANQEFGYSVRFPLKPRVSVEVEVSRMRAETEDKLDPTLFDHAGYTVSALPIVASMLYNFTSSPKVHLNGFAGLGPMQGEAIVEFKHDHFGRNIPVQIVGRKTGVYLHAGVEGEYLLTPRFAVTGRVLGRYANSGELDWNRPDFEVYFGFPDSKLGDRSVDFSGIAAHVGVRAYIGY